jgi:hypothetical protein
VAANVLNQSRMYRRSARRDVTIRYSTTTLPFEQWDTVFPNTACAVAVIDRLTHHAAIIPMTASPRKRRLSKPRSASRIRTEAVITPRCSSTRSRIRIYSWTPGVASMRPARMRARRHACNEFTLAGNGEPIEGVSVFAMRLLYFEGRRRLVPVGNWFHHPIVHSCRVVPAQA